MKILLLLSFLCSVLTLTNSAKILGILHVPVMSHYIIGSTVLKELANRGHNVTIASPFHPKETNINYKAVYLEGLNEIADGTREYIFGLGRMNSFQQMNALSDYMNNVTNVTLQNPEIQNLIRSGEKYDIITVEPFGNEALFGLSHIFNSHLVIISSSSSMWVNHYTGNVAPYSFVPYGASTWSDRMTLIEKAKNIMAHLMGSLFIGWFVWPVEKILYEENFQNVPSFEDTVNNVSLVLVNTHPILESPRPYMPNMIPIGGVHVKEPKKLPQDLQSYFDEAKEGVIYFSLGSNLQSRCLPKQKQQEILKAFGRFQQKVLWKFEDNLDNVPSNVKISNWVPQNDILAHPNLRLFISHLGVLSSIEAIYRGVPIIGIPFYGDQFANTANFVSAGFGQIILLEEITEESFAAVITEILENPRYRENIQRTSKIFQDQPDKPLDRAVFWIEHVSRHNGVKYLRSASVEVSLFQYLLLDIIGITILIVSIFLFIAYIFIKNLFRSKSVLIKKKQ